MASGSFERVSHRSLSASAFAIFFAASLTAQRVLDVVDGETLYEGGHLVSWSTELEREESLFRGDARIGDPLASHRYRVTSTAAATQPIWSPVAPCDTANAR